MSDIIKDFARIPSALVQQVAQYQSAIFSDIAGRRGAMHGRVRALRPSMVLAGSALTVEVRPGDNLMIHAALACAQAGDVLVVDGKADLTCALMGSIMMNAARKIGLAGVVIDGCVRDSLDIADMGFPVFCVGTNPNGPSKGLGGRIGHPISCGDVVVRAGDLVLADADGVVVIAADNIAALLPKAEEKLRAEAKRIDQIRLGNTEAPWLQAALEAAGVLRSGESL